MTIASCPQSTSTHSTTAKAPAREMRNGCEHPKRECYSGSTEHLPPLWLIAIRVGLCAHLQQIDLIKNFGVCVTRCYVYIPG
eukprot:m.41954 g.41954  ORF g.41954 m.41954 type:complete len:82 (+) comp14985_c0_seq6:1936-2181(+)